MVKQIKTIPLMIIPPPIITPRDKTVGCPIIDLTARGATQMRAPIIQRAVPTMIFISDLPK